ncbi:DNA helicase B [Scyliorhinus torazame]|uniref:DNA helicase B n=1 Tax=Scyliorhinus torazame TaxID=75743 RepID=UPI003B5A6C62
MSQRRADPGKTRLLEGYILSPKEKEQQDSDTEEEEEPQFLDFSDMMSVFDGASSIKASAVARHFVTIQDLESNLTYQVYGRFHFTAPWWKVTAKIKYNKGKWYLQYYPSYSLRSCLSHPRSDIILLLTKCHVHDQHKQAFFEYLPKNCNLEFSHLLTTLQLFAKKGDTEKCIAQSIIAAINSSDEWQNMQRTLMFPNLMKYLPGLLPRQVLHILMPQMENGRKPLASGTLEGLEQMIETEVWKLGFRLILSKELRLIGCEATLLAFEETDLLRTIPELQRHALVIYDQLKQTCWKKGHTYVKVDELTNLHPSEFSIESAWESLKFLKDHKIIVIEKNRGYLPCFYNSEKDIALCIKELMDKPSWHIPVAEVRRKTEGQREGLAEDVEHSEDIDLDPGQLKAVNMMCANPVTVISGKGGCGKTTLVSLLFRAVIKNMESADIEELLQACQVLERDEKAPKMWDIPASKTPDVDSGGKRSTVLFTAPTGKATSLLKKKTGFDAYTLHQVMWNFWSNKKAMLPGAPRAWMFSDVQVLIVDEGSLVSVQILSTVLNLLMKHANLKKLIILGDVRQLPSIEPGNMLSDVYSSLKRIRWSIELETNHRAESQLIVDNAAKIAEMGLKSTYRGLEYDAVMHISKDRNVTVPTPDKKFILVSLPRDLGPHVLQEAIKYLLKEAPGLENDVTSQFIAFRRMDCALINELCCKQYAGHLTRNDKNKTVFQVGDKVCCTKNGYIREFTEESEPKVKKEAEKEKHIRLCNGEIFFILQHKTEQVQNRSTEYLLLDDKENRQIFVKYKEIMRECRLQHAWARTIHTFQGSEADTVVYVVGSAGRQNWQHIYTAISRGRQRVYVVTSEDHFIQAVTAKSPRRNTRLRELLQEKLLKAGPASCIEGALSQQQPSWMSSGVPSTLAATNSTQVDSAVPPMQAMDDPVLHIAGEIKEGDGQTARQRECSFSEDLAFAQDYSWSPQSLELDHRECDEAQKNPTAACTSSPQTSDGTTGDTSVGATGQEATSSIKVEASWSPGSKRNSNTLEDEKSPQKYFKLSLMESPLGCTKFKQLTLDCPSPGRNLNAKRLFKEEK